MRSADCKESDFMTNHHCHPFLGNIERKLDIMAEKLDFLQAAETAESAEIDAAIADINALVNKLAVIPTSDPTTQAAIDALAADMTAKTKALTNAVSSSTPTPTPTPTPVPAPTPTPPVL